MLQGLPEGLTQFLVEGHAHALQVAVAGLFKGQKIQDGQAAQDGPGAGLAHARGRGDLGKGDDVGAGA
ncbi:hypothetical protein GD606_19825 (plasmid) [Desulfolutivibrio sulfodismutans DSM 3696]|nr:hypothetical protein GD606_19825 [Desulfolutivibrio sulfodismutans DSM 3696]